MTKELDFYIYLLEHYAHYKKAPTNIIIEKLEKLDLDKLIYNMYERYHIEAIENAYSDIDELIEEREKELNKP